MSKCSKNFTWKRDKMWLGHQTLLRAAWTCGPIAVGVAWALGAALGDSWRYDVATRVRVNGLYITMYVTLQPCYCQSRSSSIDKIRSIDEALSEKADNTTLPYAFKFYTSSETQMVRKHEVTSYEYICVDIACLIGPYPFVCRMVRIRRRTADVIITWTNLRAIVGN